MAFFSGFIIGLMVGVILMCLLAIIEDEDEDEDLEIELEEVKKQK